MKKTTTIAALSVAALLSASPLLVSADDDYRRGDCGDRYENRHHSKAMGSDLKQYSTEEMRIMAYGQALKRFGPGVDVSVEETSDGTYRVQLRDAEQNLIREQEFNQYGASVRGARRD
ncbi:hypothetical protein [Marinobacter sp. F4218]|uniref:hypothetical protein n=1 Tax=Marinobacter sp. F4218 TaxID=2862868 RepID=UPI001C6298DA|nr:hypothetical protein [Marinobacter sp. F4218]MBW7471685.1 hypothetical protein [Marinobacter sp. F4218]